MLGTGDRLVAVCGWLLLTLAPVAATGCRGAASGGDRGETATAGTAVLSGTTTSSNGADTSQPTDPLSTGAGSSLPNPVSTDTAGNDPGASGPAPPEPGATAPLATDSVWSPPSPSGCVGPLSGAAVVLSFDNDRLLLGTEPAPTCLRVRRSQTLRVEDRAAFGSTVSVGAQVWDVGSGGSTPAVLLADRHGVGDMIDVRVDALSATTLVQVVP